MKIKITSRGSTSAFGFGIFYNPDYKDVSIDFIKWYIAIGVNND